MSDVMETFEVFKHNLANLPQEVKTTEDLISFSKSQLGYNTHQTYKRNKMEFYYSTIFLDQVTPVSIYYKIKDIFKSYMAHVHNQIYNYVNYIKNK
jgi:hypothetical protein